MIGLEYPGLPVSKRLFFDFGAFVGPAFSTRFEGSTQDPSAANNSYSYSGLAPAVLFTTDLNWKLSTRFSFLVEAGYRQLATTQLSSPAQSPLAVDLSGPVVNLGANLHF
jgi:hypothetical protein